MRLGVGLGKIFHGRLRRPPPEWSADDRTPNLSDTGEKQKILGCKNDYLDTEEALSTQNVLKGSTTAAAATAAETIPEAIRGPSPGHWDTDM